MSWLPQSSPIIHGRASELTRRFTIAGKSYHMRALHRAEYDAGYSQRLNRGLHWWDETWLEARTVQALEGTAPLWLALGYGLVALIVTAYWH